MRERIELVHLHKTGRYSVAELAAAFGVSRKTAYKWLGRHEAEGEEALLLEALQNFAGTVILVSHDRHFLRSLVGRVFEIDHGQMMSYDGDYEYYLHKTGREHGAA